MPAQLRDILHTARLKEVPKSQILLYKGDAPAEVYILKQGAVKLYDIDDQGNEKILHITKPPTLLPFVFFSGLDRSMNWFYVTLTDCELYVLDARQLRDAMRKDGALATFLMQNFSDDVHELLLRLSSLGKTQVRDKICSALRFLLVHYTEPRKNGWHQVTFAVSHQLLADLAGVTRESTAVAMKELQESKVVRNPRLSRLDINQERLLARFSEE